MTPDLRRPVLDTRGAAPQEADGGTDRPAPRRHDRRSHVYHPRKNPTGCDKFYCLRRYRPVHYLRLAHPRLVDLYLAVLGIGLAVTLVWLHGPAKAFFYVALTVSIAGLVTLVVAALHAGWALVGDWLEGRQG